MAKRIVTKIGDVFCAEIDGKYKRYFQYITNDMSQLNSSVIRAFKSRYKISENPHIEDIVKDEVDFYAHTMLRAGIQFGVWQKIGKSKNFVIDDLKDIFFGNTSNISLDINKNIIFVDSHSNWTIWNCNGERKHVGVLSSDIRDIVEEGSVLPYNEIIARLRLGYYTYTLFEYGDIKRRPYSDVNSYMKVVDNDSIHFYQFLGKNIKREMIITETHTVKLSDKNPEADGIHLRMTPFGDTNWKHDEFITEEEFNAAWEKN